MKTYKFGSIAFLILGILHTLAHIAGNLNPNQETMVLLQEMESFKIDLFGEHTMLKFHNGFSLMMGFLLSVFGIQNLIIGKSLSKKYLLSNIISTSIMLALSVVYFHVLAIVFILFSLLCYLLTFKKRFLKKKIRSIIS